MLTSSQAEGKQREWWEERAVWSAVEDESSCHWITGVKLDQKERRRPMAWLKMGARKKERIEQGPEWWSLRKGSAKGKN